ARCRPTVGRPQTVAPSSITAPPTTAGLLAAHTPSGGMTMNKKTLKLVVAGACVAWALDAIATQTAPAPPPRGFTATNLVGPVMLDEFDTMAHAGDWKSKLKVKGLSDVYVTHIKIAPGGHGGWHSHPGPSIITVKSGTAAFYDE